MRLRYFAIGFLAFVQLFVTPKAACAQIYTLERAVETALRDNRGLQALAQQREEIAQRIKQSRSDAYPQISLVSGWTRARNPSLLNSPDFEEFIDAFPGGSFSPREQELWSAAVRVRQLLYTSGKLKASRGIVEQVAGYTEARIEAAQLDVALATAEAFYGVAAAEEAMEVFEIQERTRREALDLVQARFDMVEATRLDLLRATAALAQVKPDLVQARGRIEVAKSQLRALLALDPGTPVEVAKVQSVSDMTPQAVPGVVELLPTALGQRPELRDLDLQASALAGQRRVAEAEGRPQVDVTAQWGRTSRLVDDLSDNLFSDWMVGLGLQWELFAGGSRRAELAVYDSQVRQLELQQDDLRLRVAAEIEAAVASYRARRESLEAARVSAEAATEAARVALEVYRAGVALQHDLLNAQEQETGARVLAVQIYYQALIERARLLRSLGFLPHMNAALRPANQESVGQKGGEN